MCRVTTADDIGPVELVVLTFPGESISTEVITALTELTGNGSVRVLDLVYLSKDHSGVITQVDVDENIADVGLEQLAAGATLLISDDDLDVARDSLTPGSSALVIAYEEAWARNLARTVRADGGKVALHVQVPRDAVVAAFAAGQEKSGE